MRCFGATQSSKKDAHMHDCVSNTIFTSKMKWIARQPMVETYSMHTTERGIALGEVPIHLGDKRVVTGWVSVTPNLIRSITTEGAHSAVERDWFGCDDERLREERYWGQLKFCVTRKRDLDRTETDGLQTMRIPMLHAELVMDNERREALGWMLWLWGGQVRAQAAAQQAREPEATKPTAFCRCMAPQSPCNAKQVLAAPRGGEPSQ